MLQMLADTVYVCFQLRILDVTQVFLLKKVGLYVKTLPVKGKLAKILTKISKSRQDIILRNIGAVFFKLVSGNVHHKRNKMAPVMASLPLLARFSCCQRPNTPTYLQPF